MYILCMFFFNIAMSTYTVYDLEVPIIICLLPAGVYAKICYFVTLIADNFSHSFAILSLEYLTVIDVFSDLLYFRNVWVD